MQLLKFSVAALLSLTLLACAATQSAHTGAAPTVESLSRNGAYAIRSYISLPDAAEYGNATIYYPLDVSGPIGGVAIVPGFTETQRHINWWGSRLASHGYAVLVMDTNDLRDRPDVRGEALMAGVRTLRNENVRRDSPLYRKIDNNKMSVMGHSMGGGGALHAANLNSAELSAAIPFTSWQPSGDFSSITVPTLVIAAESDTIAAVVDHSWPHYNSIPADTQKVYLEVANGDHFVANNTTENMHGLIGSYAIAWLKLYMDGDERYRDFIYGDARSRNVAAFSRYEMNP